MRSFSLSLIFSSDALSLSLHLSASASTGIRCSLSPLSLYEPKQRTQDLQRRVCGRWPAGVRARERGSAARRRARELRATSVVPVQPPLEPICDLSDLCACVGGGRPASRAARTNAAARASVAIARNRGWCGQVRSAKLPRLARASVSVVGGAGGAGEHIRQASFLRASIQSETSFSREETVSLNFLLSWLIRLPHQYFA
jgi:hypothetical protein